MPSCIKSFRSCRACFPVGILLCVFAVFTAGCGKSDRDKSGTVNDENRKLSIFYTCDTRGNLKPCECKDGDAGGVARRMTALESMQKGDHILVDAGDVAGGGKSWEISDYAMLLTAYDVMGYHAVNLGEREAAIPLPSLKEFASGHPYLISANLAGSDGHLIADPYRVITLTNGFRVGVMGVVDDRIPSTQLGEGVQVLSLEDTVIKHMAELVSRSDLVVMLAFVDEQRLHELASVFFEVDVLIGGKVSQPQPLPDKVNRTQVVRMTDQGKHIGRLDIEVMNGEVIGTSADITYLNHEIPDAAVMAPIVTLFESSLQGNGRTDQFIKSEPGLKSLGDD